MYPLGILPFASSVSEDNKIGLRGNYGVRESEEMKYSARKGNIENSERET